PRLVDRVGALPLLELLEGQRPGVVEEVRRRSGDVVSPAQVKRPLLIVEVDRDREVAEEKLSAVLTQGLPPLLGVGELHLPALVERGLVEERLDVLLRDRGLARVAELVGLVPVDPLLPGTVLGAQLAALAARRPGAGGGLGVKPLAHLVERGPVGLQRLALDSGCSSHDGVSFCGVVILGYAPGGGIEPPLTVPGLLLSRRCSRPRRPGGPSRGSGWRYSPRPRARRRAAHPCPQRRPRPPRGSP